MAGSYSCLCENYNSTSLPFLLISIPETSTDPSIWNEYIQILADKFTNNSDLIAKQINTIFYLEMSIGRYLQVENRGTLSRKVYQIRLVLLTGIVETGSVRAYYLREHLLRSRKIAT
ncbi:hypothetical protein KBD45_07110 [Candidatus Dojkabacteria bacterium]|nr:hypothetical protein [Candidatus Dojkabacteria bacterium]